MAFVDIKKEKKEKKTHTERSIELLHNKKLFNAGSCKPDLRQIKETSVKQFNLDSCSGFCSDEEWA